LEHVIPILVVIKHSGGLSCDPLVGGVIELSGAVLVELLVDEGELVGVRLGEELLHLLYLLQLRDVLELGELVGDTPHNSVPLGEELCFGLLVEVVRLMEVHDETVEQGDLEAVLLLEEREVLVRDWL
jgi:hypothetical protein